jgi:hypothetical protein
MDGGSFRYLDCNGVLAIQYRDRRRNRHVYDPRMARKNVVLFFLKVPIVLGTRIIISWSFFFKLSPVC